MSERQVPVGERQPQRALRCDRETCATRPHCFSRRTVRGPRDRSESSNTAATASASHGSRLTTSRSMTGLLTDPIDPAGPDHSTIDPLRLGTREEHRGREPRLQVPSCRRCTRPAAARASSWCRQPVQSHSCARHTGRARRGRKREPDHTHLRRGVVGLRRRTEETGTRREVDQPEITPAVIAPVRRGMTCGVERPLEMHRNDAVPVGLAQIKDHPVTKDACDVDEDVESALHCRLDEPATRVVVGDVGRIGDRFPALALNLLRDDRGWAGDDGRSRPSLCWRR